MDRYIEFIGNNIELHLALVAVVGMLAWTVIGSRITGVRKIEPAEVVALLNNQDGVLLDVRDTSEYKQGHIVDAIHIPVSLISKRHIELSKYKQRPIIVTCRSGSRAGAACSLLRKQGYESVYMLSGGMLSWLSANFPTTRK